MAARRGTRLSICRADAPWPEITIPRNLSDDRVILLGNAVSDAAETRAISLPVAFSISTHQANLRSPPDPGAPKAAPAPPEAPEAASDPLKTRAADRARYGAFALSPSLMGGNSVSRIPVEPACAQPFMCTACGPVTTLQFSLRPAGNMNLDAVSGSDGLACQITTNVSGLFVISQPWRNDRRVKRRLAAGPAAEMIEEAFPGILVIPDVGLAANTLDSDAGASHAPRASASAACNCSCNHADSVPPSCRTQCAPVFAACAPEKPEAVAEFHATSVASSEDVDAMRAEVIGVLREVGAGEASIKAQLQMFDALPDNAKSLYLESIRGRVATLVAI